MTGVGISIDGGMSPSSDHDLVGRRRARTIKDVDEPSELRDNQNWRRAVWALRVGYGGLVIVVAGLILLATGSTPWVLAIGVVTGRRARPSWLVVFVARLQVP